MCHMSCVTCQVSNVMCHMSPVTCQVSHVRCHESQFFFFFCYQRGLPRLEEFIQVYFVTFTAIWQSLYWQKIPTFWGKHFQVKICLGKKTAFRMSGFLVNLTSRVLCVQALTAQYKEVHTD